MINRRGFIASLGAAAVAPALPQTKQTKLCTAAYGAASLTIYCKTAAISDGENVTGLAIFTGLNSQNMRYGGTVKLQHPISEEQWRMKQGSIEIIRS